MRSERVASIFGVLLALAGTAALFLPHPIESQAEAQVGRRPHRRPMASSAPAEPPDHPSTELLARFGASRVEVLADGDHDQRLQAILRAREVGTADSLSPILPTKDPLSFVRNDARLEIALVRTLADATDRPEVRATLTSVVLSPTAATKPSDRGGGLPVDEVDRLELARGMAALALASARDPEGAHALLPLLHSGGSPGNAAAAALRAYPPVDRTWTRELPTDRTDLELVRATSDLRDIAGLTALATDDSRFTVSDDDAGAVTGPDAGARPARPPRPRGPATAASAAAAPAVEPLPEMGRVLLLGALGRMDDARVVGSALRLRRDPAAAVRVASVEARLAVGAGASDSDEDCVALINEDATSSEGVRLASMMATPSKPILAALVARLAVTSDADLRARILAVLGRTSSPVALDAILPFVQDAHFAVDAVNAVARSPFPSAMATLSKLLAAPATRRLALRGYLVRALSRGERSESIEATVRSLLGAPDARDRAVARGVAAALGMMTTADAANDPDQRVVRGALLAGSPDADAALHALDHADPVTRALALVTLASVDPARIAGAELVHRVRLNEIDAPFAARALAARAHESDAATLELLASPDSVVQLEALRGYGASEAPDRLGRMNDAYLYESSADVRRVLLDRLMQSLRADGGTPSIRQTVQDAARLDPDADCRATARGFRFGGDAATVVWVHADAPTAPLAAAGATASRAARTVAAPFTALLLTREGPRPVVFDDDGDALIVRVPSGPTRLRLAPQLASYESSRP